MPHSRLHAPTSAPTVPERNGCIRFARMAVPEIRRCGCVATVNSPHPGSRIAPTELSAKSRLANGRCSRSPLVAAERKPSAWEDEALTPPPRRRRARISAPRVRLPLRTDVFPVAQQTRRGPSTKRQVSSPASGETGLCPSFKTSVRAVRALLGSSPVPEVQRCADCLRGHHGRPSWTHVIAAPVRIGHLDGRLPCLPADTVSRSR